jgi:gamma-glutamylcyclotransferase (GGCT)/AIG2-like uncharacterized protein YtfP
MNNLVAVYGSLRKGLHNAPVLGNSEYVGNTIIKGWQMFSLGSFPFVLANPDKAIKVEVYRVLSSDVEENLDYLEGYPSFYDRDDAVETGFGTASMYFMHEMYDDTAPEVVSGDWVSYLKGEG